MFDLSGKKFAVVGVADKNSICFAIAERLRTCSAEVVLVSHPVMIKKWVAELAAGIGIEHVIPCDVTDKGSMSACYYELRKHGPFDGIVHGIAAADKTELKGRYIDTSLENFTKSLEISCFSFVTFAHWAEELMPNGGSLLTLTFLAAEKPMPNYNVMGAAKAALEYSVKAAACELGQPKSGGKAIRVNAISASPTRTLSARGVSDFYEIGKHAARMSPMGRRADHREIANEAIYLLSDQSTGVTGQVRMVDCGSSVPGMPYPHVVPKYDQKQRST